MRLSLHHASCTQMYTRTHDNRQHCEKMIETVIFRVELRWYVGNDAPSYTVEYGLVGFSLGSGSQFTVAGGFKNLTGLQPDTEYQAYIRSNCSDSKVSEFSRVFHFKTKP